MAINPNPLSVHFKKEIIVFCNAISTGTHFNENNHKDLTLDLASHPCQSIKASNDRNHPVPLALWAITFFKSSLLATPFFDYRDKGGNIGSSSKIKLKNYKLAYPCIFNELYRGPRGRSAIWLILKVKKWVLHYILHLFMKRDVFFDV